MTNTSYALLSLFDKSGLTQLADALLSLGYTLLSTGGTAAALRAEGRPVTEVSTLTAFPEMLGGRVKTLHPLVHGGLLADRDKPDHQSSMSAHNIPSIDVLAVNLYPFRETRDSGASFDEIIEMIDIGGPAMIRSAAKNHRHVIVLTDPDDYAHVLEAMRQGPVDANLRKTLAARAFAHTASYDSAIATWFQSEIGEAWPRSRTLSFHHNKTLRYGENPHQSAALYLDDHSVNAPAQAPLVSGKPLSYNNLLDADAAFRLIGDFNPDEGAAVAIIKHANPCGVAVRAELIQAYEQAFACDPVSAFGGIIAMNQPLDEKVALAMLSRFVEVIIAPTASPEAIQCFSEKPNVRLLLTGPYQEGVARLVYRQVMGGFLVQTEDKTDDHPDKFQVVSARSPSAQEYADMMFAWKVVRHVKSNALVFAHEKQTLAIGAGQMSRLDSAHIARFKAEETWKKPQALSGTALASDAFFPFTDTLEVAAKAGATAVIHPGGSIKDQAVIACADELGLAMITTGVRHFRH